ncbi:HIT family protein [Candidatus Saccharibacteria bacterium]|nr:HIT family protein [Candidatus Saccharibacteria bacterium]
MRNIKENPFYGVIKEYNHWVILFRQKQVTIGSMIIMSKHLDRQSLGDVDAEAWSEFGEVCRDVETMTTRAFGAKKFNYLALMMYDPEVHFHVIPRYDVPVLFEGCEFVDPDWPEATKRVAMQLDDEMLAKIEQKLLSESRTL